MKYQLLAIILLTIRVSGAIGQSIDPIVFSSAGGQFKGSDMAIDYTFCETIVMLMGENKDLITSGIQQETFKLISDIKELNDETANISVYPNPSSGIFIIENSLLNEIGTNVKIYNSAGKLLETPKIQFGIKNLHIDLSEYPGDIYFVEFNFNQFNRTFIKKIIKI